VARDALTLPEVAEIVEVEYRTLHTWVRRGLLQPSQRSASGTGTPNLFSAQDAVTAKVLADLRRGGIAIDELARVSDALQAHREPLTEDSILLLNGQVDVVADAKSAVHALRQDALTLAYCVGHAQRAVAGALSD
jgi:DNA-binding transcriptional MerR regulator